MAADLDSFGSFWSRYSTMFVLLAGLGVTWGSLNNQISALIESNKELVVDVRNLREARITMETAVSAMRTELADAKIVGAHVADNNRRVGEAVLRLEKFEVRLRAILTNQDRFQRVLEELGKPVKLVESQ